MKKSYLLLLLFGIGLGIKFDIIGVISLSELFLIIYSPFILYNKSIFREYPALQKISWLYLGLFVSQICSELIVGNQFSDSLRGLAVTVISYLHFIFLFTYFVKDKKNILFVLAGLAIKFVLFDNHAEVSAEEVLSGEGAVFLKFRLSFIITYILFIFCALTSKKKIATISVITIGLGLIMLGARSMGLMTALAGIITYALLFSNTKINKKQLIYISIFVSIISYGLYVVYVNQVLAGNITSGNNEQILLLNNPYNPLNLLFAGRTETLIGWQAFMDSFWFGHGSWALDVAGKYHSLFSVIRNDTATIIVGGRGIIPSHSVLVGAGTYNGILAFLFMFALLFFFVKTGFKAINKKDKYIIIVIFSILSILWNGLFSPSAHFKNIMPFYFAIVLASYIINSRKKTKNSI